MTATPMDVDPFPQMREALRQQEEETERFLEVARTELMALTRRMADWDAAVEAYVHFAGPCPFLSCLQTEPHDHPVCPDCGAVRWGNMYCETCRSHRPDAMRRSFQLSELDTSRRNVRIRQTGDPP